MYIRILLAESPLPATPLSRHGGLRTCTAHAGPNTKTLVHHCAAQPAVGEAILRARPWAVVVETAVNLAHGAATGNALYTDAHARLADAGLRRLCMGAAQLAAEPDAWASRLFAVRPSSMGGSCCCADTCQGGREGSRTRMWMSLRACYQRV